MIMSRERAYTRGATVLPPPLSLSLTSLQSLLREEHGSFLHARVAGKTRGKFTTDGMNISGISTS